MKASINNLGGSIDLEYEALKREFLNQPQGISEGDWLERKVANLTVPAGDKVTANTQWPPSLTYHQTTDQMITIANRITSIQNIVNLVSTDFKQIHNSLSTIIAKNVKGIKTINQRLDNAINLDGGNIFLVQSYTDTLSFVRKYLRTVRPSDAAIINLMTLFVKIGKNADEIGAEVKKGVETFENSVTTNAITNDLFPAQHAAQELRTLLEEGNLATNIAEMVMFSTQLKKRIGVLRNNLAGRTNLNLHLKKYYEFRIEINLLEADLKQLKHFLPKLKNAQQIREALIIRLNELSMFISELQQVNFQYVVSEYQGGNPQEGLNYNGQDLAELLESK